MALKGKGGRRSSKAAQGNNNTKSRSRSKGRGGRRSSSVAQNNSSTNNNKQISRALSNDTGNGLGYIGDAIDTTASTGGPKKSLREKYASTIPNTFGETEYGLPAAGKNFLNQFLGGQQLNTAIDTGDSGLRSLLNTAYGTAGLIGDATGNEQLAKTLAAMVESGGGTFGMGRVPNFSNTIKTTKTPTTTVYRGEVFPHLTEKSLTHQMFNPTKSRKRGFEPGQFVTKDLDEALNYANPKPRHAYFNAAGELTGAPAPGLGIVKQSKIPTSEYNAAFNRANKLGEEGALLTRTPDFSLNYPATIANQFTDIRRPFNFATTPQNYGPLANAGISSLANVGSSITPSLSNVGGITSLSPLYYRNN